MLVLVLVLVLAAAALLVTSLVTSLMLWAWLSVGVSVLAALALLVDWARRRSTRVEPAVPVAPPAAVEPEPEPAAAPESPVGAAEREPDEEDTDAADLLVVTDLEVEVRVVDEHPRYHLAACGWLAGPRWACPCARRGSWGSRRARCAGRTPRWPRPGARPTRGSRPSRRPGTSAARNKPGAPPRYPEANRRRSGHHRGASGRTGRVAPVEPDGSGP